MGSKRHKKDYSLKQKNSAELKQNYKITKLKTYVTGRNTKRRKYKNNQQ